MRKKKKKLSQILSDVQKSEILTLKFQKNILKNHENHAAVFAMS